MEQDSGEAFVHPHALKHGLTEDQILRAWSNFVAKQPRATPNEDQVVCVGYAEDVPSEIQMVAVSKPWGKIIYHAMTPAQASILKELGIPRRNQK